MILQRKVNLMIIPDEFRMKVLAILRESGKSMVLYEVTNQAHAGMKISHDAEKRLIKSMSQCGWIVIKRSDVWRAHITSKGRAAYKFFLRTYGE